MKRLFADTVYWIALTNSFDQYHTKAVEVSSALGNCRLFTTEAVLTEFLNALADKGPLVRAAAVEMVEDTSTALAWYWSNEFVRAIQ